MAQAGSRQTHGGTRRRPKDRKQLILPVAARRFREVGYHNVSLAEIADLVGITAGALYRHFQGKQDLLLAVIQDGLDRFAVEIAGSGDLDDLLAKLAAVTLERRELGLLWSREARNLTPEDRDAVRHRMRDASERIAAAIAAARPDAGPAEADLLAWGVLVVFASQSYHSVGLERSAFERLLRDVARSVVTVAIRPNASAPHTPGPKSDGQLSPASRREALLASAINLFGERGYHAVGMVDIGASANITGPSVYGYFTAKSDILEMALNRGNECLLLGLHGALRRADTAEKALEILLRSYVDFVMNNTELMRLLVTEIINLPEDQQHHFRQAQHLYVTEWVTLLRAGRPELSEPAARVLVHAALGLVNDLTDVRHLRRRPALAGDLVDLGLAVLRGAAA